MTGFIEYRYENKNDPNDKLIIALSDGLLRVRKNGLDVIAYRNKTLTDFCKVTDHVTIFGPYEGPTYLGSEDDEENSCDCWKKGLE